jgi:hypothetical protein
MASAFGIRNRHRASTLGHASIIGEDKAKNLREKRQIAPIEDLCKPFILRPKRRCEPHGKIGQGCRTQAIHLPPMRERNGANRGRVPFSPPYLSRLQTAPMGRRREDPHSISTSRKSDRRRAIARLMGDESEINPLPLPPRRRGIPLGNGGYAGCPYGSGELRVLTGDCDCPICNGSGWEGMIATWVPHSSAGDPECPGFLYGLVREDGQGYIECNDCDAVIRKMPADQLQQTLNEMEAGPDVVSEQCPHCKGVNLFPAFSQTMVYTCRHCGEIVRLSNSPEIDRIFGPEE